VTADADRDKRLAAEAAAGEVVDGMLVGLGTGSTAAHAVRRVAEMGRGVEAVVTSLATERLARQLGIRVVDFARVGRCDLCIDGADEVDEACRAIKGAGGAMLREKLVAASATRMVVVADGSKRVARLGARPVPVEVLPFAHAYAEPMLAKVARTVTREGYLTDNGNLVIDCYFNVLEDAERAAAWLQSIPGVLGHGLFLSEVDAAYICDSGNIAVLERPAGGG